MCHKCLEWCQRAFGKEHPCLIDVKYWLMDVIAKQQKWGEAEATFWRVLEIDERIFGREHKNIWV